MTKILKAGPAKYSIGEHTMPNQFIEALKKALPYLKAFALEIHFKRDPKDNSIIIVIPTPMGDIEFDTDTFTNWIKDMFDGEKENEK